MSIETATVRDNPEASRYELFLDGRLIGLADYRVRGDVVVIPHTQIDPELQGQGLGAVLVRGALDHVRRTGRTVVAQCWYVARFVEENPDYEDLLDKQ
jgi:hypothetical protein